MHKIINHKLIHILLYHMNDNHKIGQNNHKMVIIKCNHKMVIIK